MKKILFTLVFISATLSQMVYSKESKGGGVVVGNGAGVVETNFQFAYHSMEKILENYIKSPNCNLQADEKDVSLKLISIVKKNFDKKDRFVFVSEKLNPGFFTTSNSEANRIAKTGLMSDSSIFINSDLLYLSNGTPALSFQNIVALLIHELGHQSGIKEHAMLDMLGVKIAGYSENLTSHYGYRNDGDKKSIYFSVTNFELPIKSTMLLFNWKNETSLNLSNTLAGSSTCTYDSESYDGIEVTNGHFAFGDKNNLIFKAWVNIFCFERFSNETFVYKKNLNIMLDGDLKVLSLIID